MSRPRCCIDKSVPYHKRVWHAVTESEDNHPRGIRGLRDMLDATAAELKAPASMVTTARWAPGRTVRVAFLSGSSAMRAAVMRAAAEWMKDANLEFVEAETGPAEVRVAFDTDDGSWSYLGTDALAVEPRLPTMNVGWRPDFATCLHLMGHAIGLAHGHRHPAAAVAWHESRVFAYYAAPPNRWTPAETRARVTERPPGPLCDGGHGQGSVMECPVPAEFLFDPGFAVGWSPELSDDDRAFVARMYPRKTTPSAPHNPDSALLSPDPATTDLSAVSIPSS